MFKKIIDEYKYVFKKIIDEYKKVWPGIVLMLCITLVTCLVIVPRVASGGIAKECFGFSKTGSVVISFAILVPWGILVAPIIRHMIRMLDKIMK